MEILIYASNKRDCLGRIDDHGLVFDHKVAGNDEYSSHCVGHVDFSGYVYVNKASFSYHTPDHRDCVGRVEGKYIYRDYRRDIEVGRIDFYKGEITYNNRCIGWVETGKDEDMGKAAAAAILLLHCR